MIVKRLLHPAGRQSVSLGERGDTIIEVLLAIAVVSTVLGITYSSMNRGLIRMRDAKERTEALKLIEGQIESLRFASGAATLSIPVAGSNAFCVVTSGAAPTITNFTDGSLPNAALGSDNLEGYPPECKRDFYRIAIKHETPKLFRFYVRWDKLGGRSAQDRNQIEMVYRTQ